MYEKYCCFIFDKDNIYKLMPVNNRLKNWSAESLI